LPASERSGTSRVFLETEGSSVLQKTPTDAKLPGVHLRAGDIALFGAVVLIWGLSWPAMRYQLGTVAPEVSGVWRFFLGAVALIVVALLRGESFRFPAKVHARLAFMGATLFSFNFALFYYAAIHVTTGLLAVLFSLAAVISVVLEALVLRRPISGRVVLGGAFGAIGVALLFYPELAEAHLGAGAVVGLALAGVGTFLFCFGSMASVGLKQHRVPVYASMAIGMLYGCAFLSALALWNGSAFTIETTAPYLISIIYLGLGSSALGYACYFPLLDRIGPARAGYVTVVMPVIALAISTFTEGYRWSVPAAIGLVVVVIGNVLVLSAPRPRA
jgi:drug/metabolite transporter (DMT)-like permease